MLPELSIVIPARDSAATIARAVADALRLAADVVVVDTGSSDDTAALAAAAGARVVDLAREASFAAARNAGAAAARGAWLLHLDSDETLAPGYLPVLQRAIAAGDFEVHELPQGNLRADGQRSLVTQRRLYRNHAGFRWVGLTCEWVYPLVPAGTLDLIIDKHDHDGQPSDEARAQRTDLMTTEVRALLHADLAAEADLGQVISRCRHLSLHGRARFDTTGLAQRAGEAFQRFCQQGETSDQPRLELARLHELRGDPARALVLYDGLPLATATASPTYLAHQAACIMAVTRNVDAALAAIDAAIARCPCALFLLTRGSILGVAGRAREAAVAVVEALRRLPALRHYRLGPG
ncbi:MAG: glycosyltransferase [Deltaproteobacteria bacterium]|nr:glycosyltransferase [Deltaproteobacteria bacterium]